MWFNTCPNTYFVEHNDRYIKKSRAYIPDDHIIKCSYKNITLCKSKSLSDQQLVDYPMPERLLELTPFDMILIDGPTGYRFYLPDRLLPCYWAGKYLSRPGTLVYLDDTHRDLESYCVRRFLKNQVVKTFPGREGCTKIIL